MSIFREFDDLPSVKQSALRGLIVLAVMGAAAAILIYSYKR